MATLQGAHTIGPVLPMVGVDGAPPQEPNCYTDASVSLPEAPEYSRAGLGVFLPSGQGCSLPPDFEDFLFGGPVAGQVRLWVPLEGPRPSTVRSEALA
eukprot:5427454-Alexandrium_andersonii.AAC.1